MFLFTTATNSGDWPPKAQFTFAPHSSKYSGTWRCSHYKRRSRTYNIKHRIRNIKNSHHHCFKKSSIKTSGAVGNQKFDDFQMPLLKRTQNQTKKYKFRQSPYKKKKNNNSYCRCISKRIIVRIVKWINRTGAHLKEQLDDFHIAALGSLNLIFLKKKNMTVKNTQKYILDKRQEKCFGNHERSFLFVKENWPFQSCHPIYF